MGMFDTVYFKCPICNEVIDIQSKAQAHPSCNEYQWRAVPFLIADEIIAEGVWCEECKVTFKVKSPTVVCELDEPYENEKEEVISLGRYIELNTWKSLSVIGQIEDFCDDQNGFIKELQNSLNDVLPKIDALLRLIERENYGMKK